jgi:hypothetical protein
MLLAFVVRQTDDAHDEIEELLTTLREERQQLPELLEAAKGPTLSEVREAQRSVEQAKKELLSLEVRVHALAEADVKRIGADLPSQGFFGSGGFFNLGALLACTAPETSEEVERRSLQQNASDARRLALRALRLAHRFEDEIKVRSKKKSDEPKKPAEEEAKRP